MSAPSSAVVRRRQRRWWYYGSTVDPLGAGNTKLIADLGVTPIAFYDVRQNLTVAGGKASSLADVSGVGTYGPALVQATGTKQPTWDGTLLSFPGGGQFLLSATTVPGLDLSGPLTMAIVLDSSAAVNGKAQVTVQDSWWASTSAALTPPQFQSTNPGNAGGPFSGVAVGGGLRLQISYLDSSIPATSVEVPNVGRVNDASPGTANLAAGNNNLSVGATSAGGATATMTFRALLCWRGNYTAAQRDTLKAWAVLRHAAILAGGLLMIALGAGRYAATTDTTATSAAYVTSAGPGRWQLDTAASSGVEVDFLSNRPTVVA